LPQLIVSGPRFLAALSTEDGPALPKASVKSAVSKCLNGLNVLLVEDQTLIALDTETMLLELGAETVASFMAVDPALTWLASASPDVGVLDINLGASASFPIAEALRRRLIPFIFTTGYGDTLMMPDVFADVEIAHKPYTREGLQQALSVCLGIDRADT